MLEKRILGWCGTCGIYMFNKGGDFYLLLLHSTSSDPWIWGDFCNLFFHFLLTSRSTLTICKRSDEWIDIAKEDLFECKWDIICKDLFSRKKNNQLSMTLAISSEPMRNPQIQEEGDSMRLLQMKLIAFIELGKIVKIIFHLCHYRISREV